MRLLLHCVEGILFGTGAVVWLVLAYIGFALLTHKPEQEPKGEIRLHPWLSDDESDDH